MRSLTVKSIDLSPYDSVSSEKKRDDVFMAVQFMAVQNTAYTNRDTFLC